MSLDTWGERDPDEVHFLSVASRDVGSERKHGGSIESWRENEDSRSAAEEKPSMPRKIIDRESTGEGYVERKKIILLVNLGIICLYIVIIVYILLFGMNFCAACLLCVLRIINT